MTQTTMEYANIVIDGFNDFANFCKEEEIISFTNKAVKECGLNQNVTMLVENVETTYDNVTTSLVQKHIVNMVEIVPTTVFIHLTRKELFSKVKKNHLLDLIKDKINDGMFTRQKYVNLVEYVFLNFLIELKNTKKVLLDEFFIGVIELVFRELVENKMIILKHVEIEK